MGGGLKDGGKGERGASNENVNPSRQEMEAAPTCQKVHRMGLEPSGLH